jgi:5S rRNA maturation endonuclease (ribonuclease M5)
MLLRELFVNVRSAIFEGGNLEVGGHQAQHIDLKTVPRSHIVAELNKLLHSINSTFQQQYKAPLWAPKLIQSQKFLSGSSIHLFNTQIPDEQFVKHKPLVGDVDTQVNKQNEASLEEFLKSIHGKQVGPATFLGYSRGNEQFSSLWEFQQPPIKVQIDLEFVEYAGDEPTQWAQFSHSSSWEDLTQGIKGVFHKYMMRAVTASSATEKYVARELKKGVKIAPTPVVDNDVSFAVSSKQGGGMRAKYKPYVDPATGQPMEQSGIPVMLEIPPAKSHYIQDLDQQFQMLFGQAPAEEDKKLMWSFGGLLQLANKYASDDARQKIADAFTVNLYGPGAQGLYKGDAHRDQAEKGIAFNALLATLKVPDPAAIRATAEQLATTYYEKYKTANLTEAEVKAQLRKGMPHLRDLKSTDFLDLLDELHQGNGEFKLQNIPLNVKVDGFGGRFGKNAEGKPFMGTSRTEPRYEAGFLAYHEKKGTTDPDILGRAKLFDDLFVQMMAAVKLVDAKFGPEFLVNKQVTCEVLYLPFATETPEGKLKFVGMHYDKLPDGVQLALVPFRVTASDTGDDLPDSHKFIKQLTSAGQQGSVMFIDNSLTQREALDVTALVPPLENIEQLKSMLADTGKGVNDRKKQVAAALEPVKLALETAIINDPNIIGKNLLGDEYEGIVINSRLGPIKVTSQEQRKVIADKNAAQAAARQEQPRENSNKTAVVAIGSFVGHIGHEQLFDYTIKKAQAVHGDPYLFIGNAEGKNDPIPVNIKLQTWHKMYPNYAKHISAVTQDGGNLMQKIKHELINPLPGKPPRYDNVIIMVGEDQAGMNIAQALMKAVNKFQGYEHVKVSMEATPRGTGMSFSQLRNILRDPNATPQQQLAVWSQGFDVNKLGTAWIKHLMDITRKGMGITKHAQPAAKDVNTRTPNLIKETNEKIRNMRAREFTVESKITDMRPEDKNAHKGVSRMRDVGGYDRVYHMNRFMMAAAMADGSNTKAVDSPSETWFEKYNTAHPYTKEEDNMVKAAMKTVPTDGQEIAPFSKSAEADDTHKTSPVAARKKNKYGV